ncbi:MAG: hypothetical protein DKINENOH_03241 [bacterium]|nr:hypothetical protein [bacterium]
MSEQKVEFSGTVQNTVCETTQSKFTGTGKITGAPAKEPVKIITVRNFITVSCALSISLTFSLVTLRLFDVQIQNLFGQFTASPSSEIPAQDTPLAKPEERISNKEAATPHAEEPWPENVPPAQVGGYIVIAKVVDREKEAMGYGAKLRQKRIRANYFFVEESRYHVYVGPFYTKGTAQTALRSVRRAGFNEAYLQPTGPQ